FFPTLPSVFVPVANTPQTPTLKQAPTYGSLDLLRKAATTTLLADSLSAYSRRTGQTRFVIDHRVIDITGYKPPRTPRPIDPLLLHAGGTSPASRIAARPERGGHARHR